MSDQTPHAPLAKRSVQLDAEVSVDRLPPVTAAGVLLIKIVLAMVMASIALLAAYLLSADIIEGASLSRATEAMMKQVGAAPTAGADQLHQLGEIARQMGEQRAAFRAFWLQMTQLILLNLLLPLLTALLGYIFGTNQVARQRDEE